MSPRPASLPDSPPPPKRAPAKAPRARRASAPKAPRDESAPIALVGDVGGTRARLALVRLGSGEAERLADEVFASAEADDLAPLAERLLAKAPGARPALAVLGVAGPVVDGEARITNLPWRLTETHLAHALGLRKVVLANDLVVAAHGCLASKPADWTVLGSAQPSLSGRNAAVIAAGTGLGEARMVWTGESHHVAPTEAGHRDFGPKTPIEVELWQFFASRFPDHVSWERVVSGAGLGALFEFFCSGSGRMPRSVEKRLAEGDRNQAIAEIGLARAFRPAARAVDMFVSLYGAEAGNLALHELAFGGVFVVGNIARTLVPERSELFVEGFRRKGRFRELLERVPIVVAGSTLGLSGAVALARREAL